MNERLRRLEARITPPAPLESLRDVGLTLKLVAHARAELDWQDRQAMKAAGDRVAADETVHKPEPLVLTLAEKKMLLEDSYAFLDYIDGQRELSPGVDIQAWRQARENDAREHRAVDGRNCRYGGRGWSSRVKRPRVQATGPHGRPRPDRGHTSERYTKHRRTRGLSKLIATFTKATSSGLPVRPVAESDHVKYLVLHDKPATLLSTNPRYPARGVWH